MLVDFKNAQVPIWKLRRGTLVEGVDGFTYITDITSLDKIGEKFIVKIYVENLGFSDSFYSDSLIWLEP